MNGSENSALRSWTQSSFGALSTGWLQLVHVGCQNATVDVLLEMLRRITIAHGDLIDTRVSIQGDLRRIEVPFIEYNTREPLWIIAHETLPRERCFIDGQTLVPFNIFLAASGRDRHPDDRSYFSRIASSVEEELLPFSPIELRWIQSLNPMVVALSTELALSGLPSDLIVLRDHLLLEKLNIVEGLLALGVAPNQIIFVAKQDSTKYRSRVAASISARGCSVLSNSQWEVIQRRVCDHNDRTVVIDDGGDLIHNVLLGVQSSRLLRLFETTSGGIDLLKRSGLAERVIDLSSSSIKRELNLAIATSCVLRWRQLLSHERLAGEKCHVIGFGNLGSHVASLLRALGMAITVSDVSPIARKQARLMGFDAYQTADEALRRMPCRFIIGCSGQPSVHYGSLMALPRDTVLASVSSKDLRPAIEKLRLVADTKSLPGIGTEFTLGSDKRFTFLADGHAINLYFAEGVNEPDFDPFNALIFLAILRAFDDEPVENLCESLRALQKSSR